MPKIGLRMIKSSIAVFLCFVIYLIRQEGIPFYSAIAAILCMQPDVMNSRRVAFNRTVGTFIGGFFGMLVMLAENHFLLLQIPMLKYLLISFIVIPLIYLTILVKKPTASYITCVVFLSITVSHGLDANPYLFTINRVADTLIGIFVSLGVNAFHLPKRKNADLLFVSDLCGTLTNTAGVISSYTRIKLNHLLQKGAQISVATRRSAASAVPLLKGIPLTLPIITLNGAALYDMNAKSYLYCKTIPAAATRQVLGVFEAHGLNCFVHTIINDILHIYYGDFTNPAEERMYHENKFHPLKNYIYGPLPEEREVVFLRAVDTPDMVRRLSREIMQLDSGSQVSVDYYPCEICPGFCFLEVYSAEASKAKAVFELERRFGLRRTAVFGDDKSDLTMIADADYGYAVANADETLRDAAANTIGDRDSDSVVKMMEKLFHSRKLI